MERDVGGSFRRKQAELRRGLPGLLQAECFADSLGQLRRRVCDLRGVGVKARYRDLPVLCNAVPSRTLKKTERLK
jgi:hypothetical protein